MSTAPFSASSWKKIHACGQAVEASLARSGVALTMGGEPTFVPIQPFGAEWQTAALGPTKLAYARRFAHAYVRAAHPGAVILETSGKHYPGAPLPRWPRDARSQATQCVLACQPPRIELRREAAQVKV